MDEHCVTSPEELITGPVSSLIPRLARSHRAHVYTPLKELGLAPGQELMLMRLWEDGPQKQSTLVAMLAVAAPTVAKMVTRLEQAGFISRYRSEDDARVVIVMLTRKGEALRPEVERIWADLEQRTVRTLDTEEQDTLKSLLARLITDLERAD